MIVITKVTAANEFIADEIVLSDPEKIPATKSPARPGNWPRVSTTINGIS